MKVRTLKTLSHVGKLTWNKLKPSLLSFLSLVYLLSCDHAAFIRGPSATIRNTERTSRKFTHPTSVTAVQIIPFDSYTTS